MRIHPTGENANLQQYLQQQSIQQEILAAIRGFGCFGSLRSHFAVNREEPDMIIT